MKNKINASINTIASILAAAGWGDIIDVSDVTLDPMWGEIEFTCGGTDYRLQVDEEGVVWQCHCSAAREPGYCWSEWELA